MNWRRAKRYDVLYEGLAIKNVLQNEIDTYESVYLGYEPIDENDVTDMYIPEADYDQCDRTNSTTFQVSVCCVYGIPIARPAQVLARIN